MRSQSGSTGSAKKIRKTHLIYKRSKVRKVCTVSILSSLKDLCSVVLSSVEAPSVAVGGKRVRRRVELDAVEHVEGAVGVGSEMALATRFFCREGEEGRRRMVQLRDWVAKREEEETRLTDSETKLSSANISKDSGIVFVSYDGEALNVGGEKDILCFAEREEAGSKSDRVRTKTRRRGRTDLLQRHPRSLHCDDVLLHDVRY